MSDPDADSRRPLRILMVAATPYFADRGCHVRIQGQARALERLGVDVRILTYGLGRDVEGGRIVRTSALPGYHRLDAAPAAGKLGLDLMLLIAVLRAGRRERCDVLHGHTQEGAAIALVAGRLLRVPVVVDLQSRRVAEELVHYGKSAPGGILFRIADAFDRRIPAAAAAVVTSTPAIAEYAQSVTGGGTRIEVVGDAIDVPESPVARDPELARSLGLDPSRPIVAYLGLLSQTQGVDLLIEAARTLHATRPDIQWLIMGYPDEAIWRDHARAAGVAQSMIFTGRMEFAEAPRHLALATVAVSAKRGSTEGNGKLLLYMSLGLPTLALDTPTNREILGSDGLYFEDHPEALADAVASAIAAPAPLRARGERLRECARTDGSWDARARQLLALYATLIR